ncbi:MAG: acyl-CoA thioesterase II [Alphaproteobacteria bacterium]|nr:acyl-CoA thioesterase II [Alphaproteobacteria bacterium]
MEQAEERRPSQDEAAGALVDLLTVEELDQDLYRGPRNPGGQGRVFGGQVIAQALMSAVGSVDPERVAHSLHAYFMRPGDERLPIIFRVERDYDGGTFSNRRVIAIQRGKPILNMTASFQKRESGLSHTAEMPDVPPPEELETESQIALRHKDRLPQKFVDFMMRPRSIELRPVESWLDPENEVRNGQRQTWFKTTGPVGDDPVMHRAILAYASDMTLLGTSMKPHGVNWLMPKMQTASLDHALWFHDDVRADEWLLYACDSPWAGGGRGFNRGHIFTRDGKLIASATQEGLIRIRQDREG